MSSAAKISSDTITKTARLARISLTADEAATFSSQLSPVLDHIENLNRLDTADIQPTFQVTSLKNILREDVVAPSLPVATALSQAAKTRDNYFVMPQTIDK